MAIEGVDYAWSRPNPAQLAAAGKKFACRYGGPGSIGKQLDAAELSGLRAAGVDVVANAEGAAAGLKGTAAGVSWAQDALAHFNALGMPRGRPIYFSADWDAGPADWGDIDAALRGAATVLGADRVGVYGSYDTINHCRTSGSARWFWMTYAWSDGRQPPSFVHLYQYRNGASLAGATLDLTRALLADYGQWGITEEDDMSEADVTAALTKFFTRDYQDAAKTQPTSRIGQDALNQGIPNPFQGKKTTTWALLQDLSNAVRALGTVDETAVASQVLASLSDLAATITAGVVAALPEATGGLTAEQVQEAVQNGVRAEFARAFGG